MNTDYHIATCEWFLLCVNDADGVAEHPILGDVPICQRCADKVGIDLDVNNGPYNENLPRMG